MTNPTPPKAAPPAAPPAPPAEKKVGESLVGESLVGESLVGAPGDVTVTYTPITSGVDRFFYGTVTKLVGAAPGEVVFTDSLKAADVIGYTRTETVEE